MVTLYHADCVCPSCGKMFTKNHKKSNGYIKVKCPRCKTKFNRDVRVLNNR